MMKNLHVVTYFTVLYRPSMVGRLAKRNYSKAVRGSVGDIIKCPSVYWVCAHQAHRIF